MSVDGAVSALAEALLNTEEFRVLKNARLAINRNKSYREMLVSFQKTQERMRDPSLPPALAERMYAEAGAEYERLNSIPEFKRYFAASGNFDAAVGTVLQKIYSEINAKL